MQILVCDNCKKQITISEALLFGHEPRVVMETKAYGIVAGFSHSYEFCSYKCAGRFIANECKPDPYPTTEPSR